MCLPGFSCFSGVRPCFRDSACLQLPNKEALCWSWFLCESWFHTKSSPDLHIFPERSPRGGGQCPLACLHPPGKGKGSKHMNTANPDIPSLDLNIWVLEAVFLTALYVPRFSWPKVQAVSTPDISVCCPRDLLSAFHWTGFCEYY